MMWICRENKIQGLTLHIRFLSRYCALSILSVCLLSSLAGCSPAPAEHKIRDVIHAFFKTKDLKVVKLEIQLIEREPIGARQYMGPRRYIVQIPLITLQPMKAESEPVDYKNATITIRKHTAGLYGWSVDNFSEIPLL